MNTNREKQTEEMEIDFGRLFNTLMKRAWLIGIVSILCAVLSFFGTFYLITPQYQSSAMFYVNNNSVSVGDASFSITSSDISASKNLVNSYIVILKTRQSLNDVIDYAGVDRSYGEVSRMIDAKAVNETEIFRVTVTSSDPEEAQKIANAISYILPKRIATIIEGTSAKIVDTAVLPSTPSSPSYMNNTLIGFALGFLLSVAIVLLRDIFDISIRTEDDIARATSQPILATVPNMASSSKGGHYYRAYEKKGEKRPVADGASKNAKPLIGSNISFAASEAYKLLRTKLQFSFADEKNCRVIGVSSALAGEGKSLTSINLAHSLSELNKRVILIDCDMRRPSLCQKLPIEKTPGLSDYLSGQSSLDLLVQNCNIPGEEEAFCVIASGRNPPNPIELLSSDRMVRMLERLKSSCVFIILDLPPVAEVSDAMAVAKNTDGMLLVVRQNHGNHVNLSAAVREFEFVGAKLLGIVYNCANEHGGSYGKYYGRYHRKYYYAYANRSSSKKNGKRDRQPGGNDSAKR